VEAAKTRLEAEPVGSPRLVLEPLAVWHAEEMAVVLDSPELHRFTGTRPDTPDELRARYERLVAGSPDELVDWLNWALRVRETGALAGTVQATVSHAGSGLVAEVAWVVGVPWQRRGFATEAARVTDEMFLTAAQAIAEQVSEDNLAAELIYPPRDRIFSASLHVAERVAACIFEEGLARVPRPADIGALIRSCVYQPVYPE